MGGRGNGKEKNRDVDIKGQVMERKKRLFLAEERRRSSALQGTKARVSGDREETERSAGGAGGRGHSAGQ